MAANDPYKLAQEEAYGQAENQWLQWLRGQNTPEAGRAFAPEGYNPISGKIDAPYTPPATVPTGTNATTGGTGTAIGGEGWGQFPGAWWSQVPQATFTDFMNDPEQFTRMWGRSHGLGEQSIQQLQQFSPMPVNFLYGLGLGGEFGPGQDFAPQKQAELQSKFLQRAIGGGGPNNQYIDPKQIVGRLVNATWDESPGANNDMIAQQVANPALPIEDQFNNFKKFVATTVGSLMPAQVMNSYMGILDREFNAYRDFLTANPTISMTFNKWVAHRLGPNGGL